ncbi:unannotated protein [freshwater metagenome]|uniref:Unannotated protein n=1 Tax=freshwater metagenome TaxID=449393 RepID=A0A6J6RDG6_9ZZZZ
MTKAMSSPMVSAPLLPPPSKPATATMSPPSAARSTVVFAVFLNT